MRANTVTARLDPETNSKLEKLSKATVRSKSFLVAEAIRSYLQQQSWQIEAIEQGIREADAGHFASDEEVRTVFSKWESGIEKD